MNDGSCGTSFRTSNTSLLIQDLEPETEYFITIAAVTEYGASLTNGTRGFTEGLLMVSYMHVQNVRLDLRT